MVLRLYAIFHLNLAYSSIEEEQRPEVVKRCYWPLLHLVRKYKLSVGVEASGYTLEVINEIDPLWIDELGRLITEGICEFIGSGYAQIIGPLVPSEVNTANLRLGHQVYERVLGFCPQIVLVNEQAYSAGLVQHYLDAGYQAVIMEWENPASFHPEWDYEGRYFPQIACGQHGEEIPLIWNSSIAFQKFQRYAHGELELDEYLEYLCRHLGGASRLFPLYGNDVEIFDFRPGRYRTEDDIHEEGEWDRIAKLLKYLKEDDRFNFIKPSQVLNWLNSPAAGSRLHLETAEQPVPTKKQYKYNLTRWALTGRDDVGINTACWRIYEALKRNPCASDEDWRELCYLWSSDFRTHITENRWEGYRKRLAGLEKQVCERKGDSKKLPASIGMPIAVINDLPDWVDVEHDRRFLFLETDQIKARLNCRRGLAIDALWFKDISEYALLGTLHHGYYDDMSLGADFYTGHLILETAGLHKVTDLNPVEPILKQVISGELIVSATIPTALGPVHKQVIFFKGEAKVALHYKLAWDEIPVGSFRLGFITLNPPAFDRKTLFYRTHNGGYQPETYPLAGKTVDHGEMISMLISASQCIGVTEGIIEIGDAEKVIRVEVDKATAALAGMVTYKEVGGTFFCRLGFSAGEVDETRNSAALGADGWTSGRILLSAGFND